MLSWAPSKDSTFFLVHNPKSITLFEPGKMRDSSIWIECLCCIFVRKLRIGIVYFLPLTSGQHEYIPLFFLSFIYLFFLGGGSYIFETTLSATCPLQQENLLGQDYSSLFSVYVCVCVSKSWHRMAISSSDDAKKRKKYKKKMSYILLII